MKTIKNKILGVVLLLVSLFIIIYAFGDSSSFYIKNLLKNAPGADFIQSINKEISTPGTLVAKIESSRAFLTKDGVFTLTNIERALVGRPAFSPDSGLDRIARDRLLDMFEKGYFEHVSPEGESASSEADLIGYEYIAIGENIALGNFENDEVLVKAWMDSPGHKENIVSLKFSHLGIAVGKGVYNGRETWIGVQIFSRPLSFCGEVDSDLKTEIDFLISDIENLSRQIEEKEVELQAMRRDRRQNRDEYNQKVEEYNALAREINTKNSYARDLINEYNSQVRKFNACLDSF